MRITCNVSSSMRHWIWLGFLLLSMCSQPAAQDEAPLGGYPQPSKRPLRVAYLHFTLQRGGVERHIINLVRSLDPSRVQASVVLTRTNASLGLLPAVSAYAYSVVSFPASRPNLDGRVERDPAGFQALINYLQRSQIDVAFSFVMGGVDDFVGLDAAAIAAVPVSIAYVGWTISIPPGLPIDALELPSDLLVELQPPENGYQLARIKSPMDLDTFSMARFKPRNHYPLRRVVVGRVSRLVIEKNPQTFILIAAEVKKYFKARSKEDPDVSILLPRFILAGDGPLKQELVELAEKHNVSDIVEFIGAVEADMIPDLLASFDIFLYPTFGESFGYVVAEALAMELPVVATSVGSIPELVDESYGFLVPPSFQYGNAHVQVIDERFLTEMAGHVLKLISDPELRAAMGSRGRARLYASGRTMREFGGAHALLYEILHEKSRATNFSSKLGYHARVDAKEWAALVQARAPVQDMRPSLSHNDWRGPSMDGVGVYVINLDRSPERLSTFLENAAKQGLDAQNICRIAAVDGRHFSKRTEHKVNSTVVDVLLDYHSRDAKEHQTNNIVDFSVRCLDLRVIGPRIKWEIGNVAVILSHLKAIRTAFDRGDEMALIFEDDIIFDDNIEDLDNCGGCAAILDAAAQLDSNWTVLQLGHLTGDDTKELERLAEAWKRGLLLVPRLPCGNADWRIFGLHTYLIHRRGMAMLLEFWWPGGVGEDPFGSVREKYSCSALHDDAASTYSGASSLSGLSFDLRLAGRVFSESIVLNLPGVYVATRPLFMQRQDFSTDTDHEDIDKHAYYHELNSRQARANAYSTSGTDNDTTRCARGVEFPPPPIDTRSATPPVDYYVWLANFEILKLEEHETHGPPWPHVNFICDTFHSPNHAIYCACMGAILREFRNVCVPSGLVRTSSYFDGAPDSALVSVARSPVASAVNTHQRLMVLLYPIAGQPQVAVFTSQDVHPATRRLSPRELAVEYCSRDAQLTQDQYNRLHDGFEAAISSFAEALISAN